MKTFLKKAGLGVALGATTLGLAAAPAQAQRWHGGYHHYHHGDAAGAALLGGIVGLGVGAAIASDHDRYYDRGYYAPPPYYGDDYYGYRYDYRPRCYVQSRWDPYYGRPVPVRVCR